MTTTETAIVHVPDVPPMVQAGQAANGAAARGLFADYRDRRAPNTLRRQDMGLDLFAHYLGDLPPDGAGILGAPTGGELAGDPAAWQGMTWGLVAGFVQWLLLRGFAIGTVNGHLSTLKTYAGEAARAKTLGAGEYAMIRLVRGYRRTEAKHVDELRIRIRRGLKKADPVPLTADQAGALKRQPDTPQGRRDAVLITLLLDHGLRAGELAGLTVNDVDLGAGELRFYRPKVDRTQTHKLTPDALRALRAYMDAGDAPALGPLLRASRKDGELAGSGMTARAISERVRVLGAAVGVAGLSAHDLRHAWATRAARNGTALDRLQDAGGWASPAMPLRYVEAAKIANAGVTLGA